MQTLDSPSVPVAAHRAPFDGRLFRRVLGLFPTGVTIVTTWDADGQPVGATVSSFNSVSLDPPLVLFSLARNMACCEAFAAGGPLAIHVLGDAQEDLSRAAPTNGPTWPTAPASTAPRCSTAPSPPSNAGPTPNTPAATTPSSWPK